MHVRLRVDIVAAALVQANAALLVQEAVAVVAQGLAQVAQGLVLHHAPEDVNLVVPELVRGLVQEPQQDHATVVASNAINIVAPVVQIPVADIAIHIAIIHVMDTVTTHVLMGQKALVLCALVLVIILAEHPVHITVPDPVTQLVKAPHLNKK